MFCHKCGAKIAENASFCHKCGSKAESTDTILQMPNTPAESGEPKGDSLAAKPTQPQMDDALPKKKKSKKLPIILGVAALVIVVVIAMNWNGKIDYEATVRAHQPFAVSQGLPYSYGEVLDKYISSPDWKVRESGDVNYVDICGAAKGTDKAIIVTIKVSPDSKDPNIVSIVPESVMVDNEKTTAQNEAVKFLLAMFAAYDEKYDDLSNFSEMLNELDATLQKEVSLTETYQNDAAGISFHYPAGWVILDANSEFVIVEMIDSKNNVNSIASFKVLCIFDQDPYGVFTQDEETIRKTVNEYDTFLKFKDILIDNVPAKGLMYRTEGLKGDDIVTNFWYVMGDNVYQIICSYSASASDTYETIFNAIMDSYTITAVNTSDQSGMANSTEFPLVVSADAMNVFSEWAAKHPLVGDYHLDLISDDDVDNEGNKIFLFTYEGNGGLFNMSIRKSDGYMEYISKFDTISMDEWYNSFFDEEDMGAGKTNSGPVNSIDDAVKLVENWMFDHPIGADATIDTGAPANDIESIRAEYYVIVLWSSPGNALGFIYVRKIDGYMAFQDINGEELIDLNEWYKALPAAS